MLYSNMNFCQALVFPHYLITSVTAWNTIMSSPSLKMSFRSRRWFFLTLCKTSRWVLSSNKAVALLDPPHGQKKTRRSQHLARGVLFHLGGVSLNHNGPFVASQKRDLLLFIDFLPFLAVHWQDSDALLLENIKWILHITQYGTLLVWMSLG